VASSHSVLDSAFAVILRGSRVLIVRTYDGKWQLPGGRLEGGEKHWDAARREVREETGLRVTILGLTGVYGRGDRSRAAVFAARARRGAATAGPRFEIIEQRWVPLRKAVRKLRKAHRRRLLDAISSPESFATKRAGAAQWRSALHRSG